MVVSIKSINFSKFGAIAILGLSMSLGGFTPLTPVSSARAQGPVSVADIAENLLSAVVNISTSQKVKQKRPASPVPRVPEGSPFQEFFDELFPNGRPGPNGTPGKKPNAKPGQRPRTVQSLRARASARMHCFIKVCAWARGCKSVPALFANQMR